MARRMQKKAKKKPAKTKPTPKKIAQKKPARKTRAKTVQPKKRVLKLVKKTAAKKRSIRSRRSTVKRSGRVKIEAPSSVSSPPPDETVVRLLESVTGRELPSNYGDNAIHVLVRDPEYVYAFWEIQQEYAEHVLAELGGNWKCVESILRVFDVSDEAKESYFDVPLRSLENNYFIHVEPNRSYAVEIGLLHQDGRYLTLAAAGKITTPRDAASEVIDEKWRAIYFEKIYVASGGLDVGLSSLGLRRMMEERLRAQLSSHGSAAAKSSTRKYTGGPVANVTSNHR